MLSPEVLGEGFTQTLNPWRSLFVTHRSYPQTPLVKSYPKIEAPPLCRAKITEYSLALVHPPRSPW